MSSVSSSALATFAAGCFWSVELAFQREPGVLSTQVGYTGGHQANPTYQQVCTGSTGHAEAVRLIYDPKVVSYRQLLRVFFDKHDSTQLNRQGNDVGTQYRSAIYYHTNEQKKEAETFIIEEQSKHRSKIATEVAAAGPWYAAEEYHQKYLEKGGQCAAKGDKTKIRCYG